ncbi:glycerophosphodiester phosphodiesterase [Azohydromonas lata]|uniref:glycerophosphodiester phosphodiesterase n=1 Tax=Azohydromonas lata TaxID=45677 RepID=A0ABU5IEP8_9BURK|nr:glycerophosphodiester phosphodiesterase [Azohydromonas lata]MDZ5457432.1 glycerophosphodiester phosphodiesterase [Azohydromonas lata]
MMILRRRLLAGLSAALVMVAPAAMAAPPGQDKPGAAEPVVIAHRGASGYLPEHTLAAYWMAIEMGADYIEPDLVSTQDGVLVARHENAIAILNADGSVREATTDVADRPEFAARRATKTIDGVTLTGWFTEDFTLAELKTLRARERLPALRVANARFDGMFQVPTLTEILRLVKDANDRRRERAGGKPWRAVGLYPETKHPSYFQGLGLSLEEPLVRTLHAWGYQSRKDPVFIQSFEVANLRKLAGMTRLPLVQLLNGSGQPWDFTVSGDARTYADLAKPAGLADIAGYAQGVGANTSLMIPLVAGRLGTPTTLVRDAHAAGLLVHGWTFRAENQFLPDDFDQGSDPAALGDLAGQVRAFLNLGMDGFFTDHAFLGVQARNGWQRR